MINLYNYYFGETKDKNNGEYHLEKILPQCLENIVQNKFDKKELLENIKLLLKLYINNKQYIELLQKSCNDFRELNYKIIYENCNLKNENKKYSLSPEIIKELIG